MDAGDWGRGRCRHFGGMVDFSIVVFTIIVSIAIEIITLMMIIR